MPPHPAALPEGFIAVMPDGEEIPYAITPGPSDDTLTIAGPCPRCFTRERDNHVPLTQALQKSRLTFTVLRRLFRVDSLGRASLQEGAYVVKHAGCYEGVLYRGWWVARRG